MLSFELSGIAGLYLKFEGNLLDAVVSLPASVLNPPVKTYMRYSAGAATLARGVSLVGQTSSAIIQVEEVVVTSGTLAGGDAVGIVFVTVVSGTPVTGENFRTAVPATLFISRSPVYTIPGAQKADGPLEAKSLILVCETNPIRILWDGSLPTNAAETGDVSYGILLNPLDAQQIKGWQNVRNLKMINAASASNGTANIIICYGGVE